MFATTTNNAKPTAFHLSLLGMLNDPPTRVHQGEIHEKRI
jgi:hypothetical protein